MTNPDFFEKRPYNLFIKSCLKLTYKSHNQSNGKHDDHDPEQNRNARKLHSNLLRNAIKRAGLAPKRETAPIAACHAAALWTFRALHLVKFISVSQKMIDMDFYL